MIIPQCKASYNEMISVSEGIRLSNVVKEKYAKTCDFKALGKSCIDCKHKKKIKFSIRCEIKNKYLSTVNQICHRYESVTLATS